MSSHRGRGEQSYEAEERAASRETGFLFCGVDKKVAWKFISYRGTCLLPVLLLAGFAKYR